MKNEKILSRGLGNRLSFVVRHRTVGGENMSEQNEFGRVSVEELEKAFETEEQEEEKE